MLTAEERRTVAAWAEAFLAFVRYEKENGSTKVRWLAFPLPKPAPNRRRQEAQAE